MSCRFGSGNTGRSSCSDSYGELCRALGLARKPEGVTRPLLSLSHCVRAPRPSGQAECPQRSRSVISSPSSLTAKSLQATSAPSWNSSEFHLYSLGRSSSCEGRHGSARRRCGKDGWLLRLAGARAGRTSPLRKTGKARLES